MIESNVETIARDVITGWVLDTERPDSALLVEVVLDNRIIASAVADIWRADLEAANKGNGRHAFQINIRPPITGDRVPIVRLADDPSILLNGTTNRSFSADKPIYDPNAANNHQLCGWVEHISNTRIVGWAMDKNFINEPVDVTVTHNGNFLVQERAIEPRDDLKDHGYGDGRHGFDFDLSVFNLDSVAGLRVLFTKNGEEISGSAAAAQLVDISDKVLPHETNTFNLSAKPQYEGYVDTLTRKNAQGWVWCPQDPQREIWVEAVINNRVIGRTRADIMRGDLLKYGKGTGMYGYSLDFDHFLIEDETPEIRVAELGHYVIQCETRLPPLLPAEKSKFVSSTVEDLIQDHYRFTNAGPDYEDVEEGLLTRLDSKTGTTFPLVIAYYLPQFHPIPENDEFWGRGFTEWRQLPRGLSRFPGHYQPRIPRDLGFYELGGTDILNRQSKMAKDAGIGAFCYYYYWFNGQKVLDRPVAAHLSSNVDMPFLLMWANENWTRTWDGFESSVLLRQDYRDDDEDALLSDLARHFDDPRYVKLDGKPLFIIYNAGHIPNAPTTLARWRNKLRKAHGQDPILFMAQAFDKIDPRPFGLDGAIEFPPHKLAAPHPGRHMPDAYSSDFSGRVIEYDDFVATSLLEVESEYPLIKTAVPSWDNDARRPNRGLVLEGLSPRKYEAWISGLVQHALSNPVFGRPIIAINAWNEWAEAAYLEPDVYYGGAFLNATARGIVKGIDAHSSAITRWSRSIGLTVILPCYNHERFLPERIGSILNQTVRPDEILFLDDCSTDGSVMVAERLLADSGIPYRILRNETNSGGVFHQWIKGLHLAENGLIWIAETDDSADPAFLENLLPAFDHEDVLAAYGHIRCIDPESKVRNDLDKYFDGLRDVTWNQSWKISATQAFGHDFAIRNIIPNASGLVFRKPILSEEEKNRLLKYRFAGDWYFYALMLRGGTLAYQHKAKSYFRVNPTSASRSSFFTENHIVEHGMILEDIHREYGLTPRALQRHCEHLAVYFPDEDAGRLYQRFQKVMNVPRVRPPLRLCIVAYSFSVGGGEVLPVDLANKLRDLGHHITYVILNHDLPEGAANIRHRLRVDIPVFHWEQISKDFNGFLEKYAIDVLNTHNVGADIHISRLNRPISQTWLVSLHGGYETVPEYITPQFLDYMKHNVSEFFYLAEKNKALLVDRGLEQKLFCQSFNAIPDKEVIWVDRAAFRREHGIPEGAFCLMICSRAIAGKGWDIAVDVTLAAAERSGRDVHICLIGGGPVEDEMRQTYADHPLVHVLGFIPDPMRSFRCFDLAIFPSTYSGESFPLFLLECFEAGLPVITTSIGEIPRIFSHARHLPGEIVEWTMHKQDITHKMTEIVTKFIENDQLRVRSVASAREIAAVYSISNLVNLYIERIHMLMRAPKAL